MEVKPDGIYFKKTSKNNDILVEAESEGINTYGNGFLRLPHDYLSGLSERHLKKLNLSFSPHRLKIESKGRFGGARFTINFYFMGSSGERLKVEKTHGCYYKIKESFFIIHKSKYELIKCIEELNKIERNLDERSAIFGKLKSLLPEDVATDKEIQNIEIFNISQFSLDIIDQNNFTLVPEIRTSKNLPLDISENFKSNFQKGRVGQGRKINNCYVVYSNQVKKCFQVIKEMNLKTPSERRSFFYNPKKYFKDCLDIPDGDEIIESLFIESEHWKSGRIMHLGKWVPKAGAYIPDAENQAEWIPKEVLSVPLHDEEGREYFVHVRPKQLNGLIEEIQKSKKKTITFDGQTIPANKETLEKLKDIKKALSKINEKEPTGEPLTENQLSRIVPIIRDNLDEWTYARDSDSEIVVDKVLPLAEIKTKLLPHQQRGVSWLQDNFVKRNPGVILADDMGLGKTLQILTFLAWMKKAYGMDKTLEEKPFLIVAPKALLKNWQVEHDLHLNQSLGNAFNGHGAGLRGNSRAVVLDRFKSSHWTITTYETLRDKEHFFREIEWGVIVFDEAQKIKNPNSLMSEMAKAMSSDFSVAVTGTPIENTLIDLWCISDCVFPKKFGTLKNFVQQYCKPESQLESLVQKALKESPAFMIKRWKGEISADLPKKEIVEYKIDLSEVQKRAYDAIVKKAQNKEYQTPMIAMQEIKRFTLFVDDNVDDEKLEEDNAKIKKACKIIEEKIKPKKEKVIIFLNNIRLQKRLVSFFKNRFSMSNAPSCINGTFSAGDRKRIVDNFQNNGNTFDILLATPKSAGVGLTVTAANHVIHLDRWWNPAVEDQCTDRVYRIGQNKSVFVHIPIAIHSELKERSFDILLDELLKNKRVSAQKVIAISEPSHEEKSDIYTKITGDSPKHYKQDDFYRSEEWTKIRKQVLEKYGAKCMNPKCNYQGEDIHVDHIKSRSKYPEKELDFTNLQVLCKTCNLKKSDSDSEEWRFI